MGGIKLKASAQKMTANSCLLLTYTIRASQLGLAFNGGGREGARSGCMRKHGIRSIDQQKRYCEGDLENY
jgi:hypothetical protein